MFSSALLLFGLASIFQHAMPYKPGRRFPSFVQVPVESGEMPYHVLLKNVITDSYFCGGTILTSVHILTAAECVIGRNREEIRVHVGLMRLNQTVNMQWIKEIREIIIHEEYDPHVPWNNDIALLKLSLKYRPKHIMFYGSLLSESEFNEMSKETRPLFGTVYGYGITSDKLPPEHFQMLKTMTQVYSWGYCEMMFQTYLQYQISESQICGYDPYIFPSINCNKSRTGDVGGPLIYENSVIGIGLSADFKAKIKEQFMLLYTNVSSHKKWIFFHVRQDDFSYIDITPTPYSQ